MSFLTQHFVSGALRGSRSVQQFPDPFCDYASLAMPSTFTDALKWCWLPDTPIEMADLSLKRIGDIRDGDVVLNKNGEPGTVVRYSCRPVSEMIRQITVGSLGAKLPLKLTAGHNLFVVKAPQGKKPSELNFDELPVEKVPAADVTIGDFLVTPLPIEPDQPATCPYDGYIIGMYLAEAVTVRNDDRDMSTKFYMGEADEILGVAERLRKLIEDATGYPQEITTPEGRPDVRVLHVCDPMMPGWLSQRFPGSAKTKVANCAMQFKPETRLRILAGWIDGDGSINNCKGRFNGATGWTTSFLLAYQMQRIGHSLGMTPGLCKTFNAKGKGKRGAAGGGYAVHFSKKDTARLKEWSVKVANAEATLEGFEAKAGGAIRSFIRGNYVYRRVTGVAEEEYEGEVCNFEVEGEHSYVAGGVASANCEYLILNNGVYRSAIERVISYFLTEIEIDGTDREGKESYLDYLYNTMGIDQVLKLAALDYLTYGNYLGSVIIPFRRYLSCPKCGYEAPLKTVANNAAYKFRWVNEFRATCPKCRYAGRWTHTDRRSSEEDDLTVKRWNIHEIELLWDPYSEATAHVWRIPAYYKSHITRGTLHILEHAPWEVVQAAQQNKHILFNSDVIYHAKEDTLCGVLNKGWGISRVLTNFRQAWYVQVLHRYNEAIGLDYIIPFRVLTPEPRSGSGGQNGMMGDPLFTADMGGVTGMINSMLAQRRIDPTSWFSLPFPIRYQALGAEASEMAPYQLMDQGMDTLLNSMNVPVEFYKGSLTLQAAPTALRLMESSWTHLVYMLNRFLQWLVSKISTALSWDEVTARLERPSHADDLNRQLAKLQLMMGQQISQTTGLKSIGLKFHEEQDRLLDEQKYVAERSQEVQTELEQAGLGDQMAQGLLAGPGAGVTGGPPAPAGAAGGVAAGNEVQSPSEGAPPAAGAGMVPTDPVEAMLAQLPVSELETITPQELYEIATTLAQQIFGLPSTQRISALRRLKQRNEMLHSVVKSRLEALDNQAKQRGQIMMQQAAQATQQQSMAPMPTG